MKSKNNLLQSLKGILQNLKKTFFQKEIVIHLGEGGRAGVLAPLVCSLASAQQFPESSQVPHLLHIKT